MPDVDQRISAVFTEMDFKLPISGWEGPIREKSIPARTISRNMTGMSERWKQESRQPLHRFWNFCRNITKNEKPVTANVWTQ